MYCKWSCPSRPRTGIIETHIMISFRSHSRQEDLGHWRTRSPEGTNPTGSANSFYYNLTLAQYWPWLGEAFCDIPKLFSGWGFYYSLFNLGCNMWVESLRWEKCSPWPQPPWRRGWWGWETAGGEAWQKQAAGHRRN